jgi:N-acetylmuramoyl-L-alanine amidase
VKQIVSPNFNARDTSIAVNYIVVHYTGMRSAAEALARLCDAGAEVSAHYLIEEDGSVTQLVDEADRAWHAGKSSWRGIADMNSASIGIELVNPGHEFGYRKFPDAQIAALKKLMGEIIVRRQMTATLAPVAHSDIAPERKQDPGELFPWRGLAQEGLGLWPVPEAADHVAASEAEITVMLGAVGYDVSSMQTAVLAFQRHYYPEQLTGIADAATIARLRALKRLIGC